MWVRLGRLDPEFDVWLDAEQVSGPATTQVALSGPGWERVFVVQTPAADQMTLVGKSRVPALRAAPEPATLPAFGPTQPAFLPAQDWSHLDVPPDQPGALSLVLSILGWVVAVLASAAVIGLATGRLDAQVIQSPSMSPTLNPGDLYVGLGTGLRQPQVGDVAAFTTRTLDGGEVAVFVHRIIDVAPTGYVTKGDANAQAEALPTAPGDVRSTAWFTMPFGGLFISLRPVMIALLGGLVALLLIRLRDQWRR